MFICVLLSMPVWAQRQVLRGEVLLVDENGNGTSAAGVEVTVKDTGDTDIADGKGVFRITLPQTYTPGRQITVGVAKQGCAIWQPLEGRTPIPDGLLTIRLLPKGSRKFWTDAFIQAFIEKTAEEAKLQIKADQRDKPKPVDFGPMIRDWAAKYGFSPEDVKEQVEKWSADIQQAQADFYKLGLAAFADHNFGKASELFNEAGRNSEKQLAAVKKQQMELDRKHARLLEETVRNYRKAGDASYSSYAFVEARSAYEKALGFVEREREPELWAAVQVDLGRASQEIGSHTEGPAVTKNLAQAVAAYRSALQVYTRQQLPQQWAMTQNNLGTVLRDQGTRTGGEEGRQLLVQAVTVYRSALEVYTREQLPQDWAMTQSNLGNALQEQGTRTGGEEGRQFLAQAVAAYRFALQVRTREQLPQHWAATQNNLGVALKEQGTRTGGEEGRQLLAQAVAAYRSALEVRTRGQLPQDWAMTQHNLGVALKEQGTRTGGEEGRQLLAQAVAAYRSALEVRTRGQLPQDWAMTQITLGNALKEQGTRTGGEEGRRLLAEAVAAYRSALEVYTREQLPQQWAMTQNNLGNALLEQGTRTGDEEGRQLLAQAVAAYRSALQVRTREQLPQDWAQTQNNLGTALDEQGTRTGGEEGRQLLGQAVAAYRSALEVRTREHLPQDWAQTQNNLGNALAEQGTRTGGEEGRQLLAQAVMAYRSALEVRTREQLPQDWAITQNNLGLALQRQGIRTGGEEGRQLLAQSVAAYRSALEVLTREQLPQSWATTQNNLGIALREQGVRTTGDEGQQLLAQAVTAIQNALTIRTPEALPPQWAQTQNNLARSYVALGQLADAGQSLRNVLSINPDDAEGYSLLGELYHDKLFDFGAASALHQGWLKRHPDDLPAREDLAEAVFTIGRFAEAVERAKDLLRDPTLNSSSQTALRALEIAASLALGVRQPVPGKLRELIEFISAQPADFKLEWSWNGTLHFIQSDDRLAPVRGWLLSFLAALQRPDREAILHDLRATADTLPTALKSLSVSQANSHSIGSRRPGSQFHAPANGRVTRFFPLVRATLNSRAAAT
jgi:tetratricopeptide (TPR) repeat protein